jgi:hypothetical protein
MSDRKNERVTIHMCYFREGNKDPCTNNPEWKLESTAKIYRFKVCDEHLAWGIRLCGFPALVDQWAPDKP